MRGLAFLFLTSAALDWPTWILDRAGVALLGLACIAAALPPRPRRIRRPAMPFVPARTVELDDEADEVIGVAAQRVSDYLATAGRPT